MASAFIVSGRRDERLSAISRCCKWQPDDGCLCAPVFRVHLPQRVSSTTPAPVAGSASVAGIVTVIFLATMRIQIAADLHLEMLHRSFPDYNPVGSSDADVLVLAGD